MTQRDPKINIYKLPGGLDVAGIAVRELFVRDDLEIGIRTDQNVPEANRDTMVSLMQAQKRESVRLSLVAIQREPDGQWERVNEPLAFMEMDGWTHQTYAYLLRAYNELNGTSVEEDFQKGARRVSSTELFAMVNLAPVG